MNDFLVKIKSEYKSEYKKVSNFHMEKFSKPKIYTGGKDFDIKKRWYVYYEYRNPHIRG